MCSCLLDALSLPKGNRAALRQGQRSGHRSPHLDRLRARVTARRTWKDSALVLGRILGQGGGDRRDVGRTDPAAAADIAGAGGDPRDGEAGIEGSIA